MARNECEAVDALKMIEEVTTNAQQIQQQILDEILKRNAGTEYLKQFLNGQTDIQLFKKNVPVVTYEDIMPYIDRIANGEPSDILVADPIVEFFRSTGTSGGKPKLIPATAESSSKSIRGLVLLLGPPVTKHFGDLNQAKKRLEFMFVKEEAETPCGLKIRYLSTSYYKSCAFRDIVSKHCTSPIETIICSDTKQSMYCQLLAGLIQRDEVVTFGSIFATTVLRAIKFLEHNWKELCSNIRTGQLSNWITDTGCRNALSSIIRANPELAVSIENICGSKSWEGIIRKLWPQAKLVSAISTGAMLQYTEALDFYSGGLPLVSSPYASSEAIFGINLEPLSKPAEVSYTFLPNMAYFEFLPLKKDCISMSQDIALDGATQHESKETQSNNEDMKPVDLVDVQLGQYYEVLVTNNAGLYRYRVGDILKVAAFHNNTPKFQFVERSSVILSIDLDKTSEADLLKAITEAKTLVDSLGFILTNYTSYGDISSTPGHYVIFWELKSKEDDDIKEVDPKIMIECCSRLEMSLNDEYKHCRKANAIAPLEIRVVKQGTFDALMDFYVSQGASMSQYKIPSSIKFKDALKILDSRVIGKFFSPSSTPTKF